MNLMDFEDVKRNIKKHMAENLRWLHLGEKKNTENQDEDAKKLYLGTKFKMEL